MLSFYLSATWRYIAQMLPCMLCAGIIFFLLRPRRKRHLTAEGLESGRWRESALFLFVLFCAGLGALTLFPDGFWTPFHWYWVLQGAVPVFDPADLSFQLQRIQWIPLQNILNGGGRIGWGLFMFLGNVIMFAPLGFFAALLWQKPSWKKSLLTGFCSSFFIEVVQFFIGRGSDINDVILNSLGALCGFWFFCLLRRFMPRFTKKFQCTRLEVPHGREIGDRTASP